MRSTEYPGRRTARARPPPQRYRRSLRNAAYGHPERCLRRRWRWTHPTRYAHRIEVWASNMARMPRWVGSPARCTGSSMCGRCRPARLCHSSCADAANRPRRRSRSSARSRGQRRRREPARNRSTPNRRRGSCRRERFRCPPTATLASRLPPPTRPASPRQLRFRAHRADSACPRRSTRHARQGRQAAGPGLDAVKLEHVAVHGYVLAVRDQLSTASLDRAAS